jgi:L-asparaginase
MTLALVATGGTIASADGDRLTGADIRATVPGVTARVVEFGTFPSSRFTRRRMADLCREVRALDGDPDVDGVVVTQGTDTLAEVAYFLELTYGGSTPIVVTGAMRTPDDAGPDGPANVRAAAAVARDDGARDAGVLVAFADRVFAAREVRKAHTQRVDAFRAPEFGPLAAVDADGVAWRRDPPARERYDPDLDALPGDVRVVTAGVATAAAGVEAAVDADGVVVAALGAGNVPPAVTEGVRAVREAGVPVVVAPRSAEGRLSAATLSAGDPSLAALGCLRSERSPPKARVKLLVALAAGDGAVGRAFAPAGASGERGDGAVK